MKRRNEKGFTLIEVVIAVTVAVLISVSALSVVLMTRSMNINASRKYNAVGQVSSILECFKAADSRAEFEDALNFTYGSGDAPMNYSIGDRKNYTLYFYFNTEGLPVTETVDADFTGSYSYCVIASIRCDSEADFSNATFSAAVYNTVGEDSIEKNDTSLLIFDYEDEVEGGYIKGKGGSRA